MIVNENVIFDTHAHYDDEAFEIDREEVLNSLKNNNVCGIINAGTDIKSSEKVLELAKKWDFIYPALGIHPENLDDSCDCEDLISKLRNLILNNKNVVAVGEIGLDYHFKNDNKELQKHIFENQIELANELGLPVTVHDREAHADTMQILKKYSPKGVVHCFSGSLEMANEVIKLGMYIGVGGVVTFKNAKTIIDVVKNISLEKIVLETDAPYMSPTPFRGKRCTSDLIKYTAEKIAEIKVISVDEVLETTKETAIKLFKI